MGGRLLLLLAILAGLVAAAAGGAANPQLAYLQKTLKKNMVAAFEKDAPSLTITTVACTLPKDGGRTSKCTAHFKTKGATGYYHVAATLTAKGTLKWTTTGHPVCFDAKGARLAC